MSGVDQGKSASQRPTSPDHWATQPTAIQYNTKNLKLKHTRPSLQLAT